VLGVEVLCSSDFIGSVGVHVSYTGPAPSYMGLVADLVLMGFDKVMLLGGALLLNTEGKNGEVYSHKSI